MKFISLFSGIGGFDLGFERAGMQCVAQVEIDENCLELLSRQFPNSERYTDVKEFHYGKTIDLVCGGFPCQDVSVAGRRAGLAGKRSGLWFEFARIIEELGPRWVVIENVPGLLSSCGCPACGAMRRLLRIHTYLRRKRKIHQSCAICHAAGRLLASHRGRDFAIILQWLVKRGYGVSWRVLDAQYFGVPQRRRRVFIVASLGSGGSAEVLFESEGVQGDIEESKKAGEGFARVAGTLASSGGGLDRPAGNANELDFCVPSVFHDTGKGWYSEAEQHRALSARDWHDGGPGMVVQSGAEKDGIMVAKKRGGFGWSVSDDVSPTLESEGGSHTGGPERIPIVFQQNTRDEVRLMGGDGRYAGAISAEAGAKQQNYIAFTARDHGNDLGENVSPTLRSISGQAGGHGAAVAYGIYDETTPKVGEDVMPTLRNRDQGGGFGQAVGGSFGVRRLVPVECERLQGFPDGWTDGFADTIRYRMLGNAVAVPCAEWIGKRIMGIRS